MKWKYVFTNQHLTKLRTEIDDAGGFGESAQCDHLIPLQTDHLIPEQSDHRFPLQSYHLM